MHINLFVGSVDGAAEQAGEILVAALSSNGHVVNVESKPIFKNMLKSQERLLLIVTSTTGEGELPSDFSAFWRKLYTKRPSLQGMRYAVAVLGDSSYGDDYCLGGITLNAQLESLGATKIREPLLIDEEEKSMSPNADITNWGVTLTNSLTV